jgi:hypothetical protein
MHFVPAANGTKHDGNIMDPRPDMLERAFRSDHAGTAAKAHRLSLPTPVAGRATRGFQSFFKQYSPANRKFLPGSDNFFAAIIFQIESKTKSPKGDKKRLEPTMETFWENPRPDLPLRVARENGIGSSDENNCRRAFTGI